MSNVKECLTDMEFMNFCDLDPTSAERQASSNHLSSCEVCRQKMADINSNPDINETDVEVPADLVSRANRTIRLHLIAKQSMLWLRSTHLWLGVFCVFIIASFIFPKYFIQCLLVALITGAKWLIESRTAKNNLTIISNNSSENEAIEKSRLDATKPIDME
ncbi:MAG: hypothetical protein ACI9CF_000050 [Candidatus Omnitrophota bacterium]|jgi:hypothetical protein